jgi:hypothetical protein
MSLGKLLTYKSNRYLYHKKLNLKQLILGRMYMVIVIFPITYAPFVCWKVVSFWKVNSGKVNSGKVNYFLMFGSVIEKRTYTTLGKLLTYKNNRYLYHKKLNIKQLILGMMYMEIVIFPITYSPFVCWKVVSF